MRFHQMKNAASATGARTRTPPNLVHYSVFLTPTRHSSSCTWVKDYQANVDATAD